MAVSKAGILRDSLNWASPRSGEGNQIPLSVRGLARTFKPPSIYAPYFKQDEASHFSLADELLLCNFPRSLMALAFPAPCALSQEGRHERFWWGTAGRGYTWQMFNKDSRRGPQKLEQMLHRSSSMLMTHMIYDLSFKHQLWARDCEIPAQVSVRGSDVGPQEDEVTSTWSRWVRCVLFW